MGYCLTNFSLVDHPVLVSQDVDRQIAKGEGVYDQLESDLPTKCSAYRLMIDGCEPWMVRVNLPHNCCEFYAIILEENLLVDPDTVDPNCLLRNPKYVETMQMLDEIYGEIFG